MTDKPSIVDDCSMKRKRDELELRKLEVEKHFVGIDRCMEKYEAVCVNTTLDERAKHIFKEAILRIATGRSAPITVETPPPPTGEIPVRPRRKVYTQAQIKQLVSTAISNDDPATQVFLDFNQMLDQDLMLLNTAPAGITTDNIHRAGKPSGMGEYRSIGICYMGPRVAISRLRGLKLVKEAYGAEDSGVQYLVVILFNHAGIKLEQVVATASEIIPLKLQCVSVYGNNQPTRDGILAAIKMPSTNKWMFNTRHCVFDQLP